MDKHDSDIEKVQINSIPKSYLDIIDIFLKDNKFGTISLIIQNGKIVGYDVLEKKRESM